MFWKSCFIFITSLFFQSQRQGGLREPTIPILSAQALPPSTVAHREQRDVVIDNCGKQRLFSSLTMNESGSYIRRWTGLNP